MTVRVILTEAAQEEHLEALRFYREGGLHVARLPKREVALLRKRPYLGPPYMEGTRRKVFQNFPYSFIYIVEDDLIVIYAVTHHSRDPEYGLDRVKIRGR